MPGRCISHMSRRNAGAVAVTTLLGLLFGFLGLVEDDLYAVGVLILFLGGAGATVLVAEYLIRFIGSRRPPVLRFLLTLLVRTPTEGRAVVRAHDTTTGFADNGAP